MLNDYLPLCFERYWPGRSSLPLHMRFSWLSFHDCFWEFFDCRSVMYRTNFYYQLIQSLIPECIYLFYVLCIHWFPRMKAKLEFANNFVYHLGFLSLQIALFIDYLNQRRLTTVEVPSAQLYECQPFGQPAIIPPQFCVRSGQPAKRSTQLCATEQTCLAP